MLHTFVIDVRVAICVDSRFVAPFQLTAKASNSQVCGIGTWSWHHRRSRSSPDASQFTPAGHLLLQPVLSKYLFMLDSYFYL